jgi:hypothetical protein
MFDSARRQQAADVYHCELDDEFVVFHPSRQIYIRLRDSAAAIWKLLAEPCTLSELVAELTASYDIEEERCRHETAEFLTQLAEAGLLRTS